MLAFSNYKSNSLSPIINDPDLWKSNSESYKETENLFFHVKGSCITELPNSLQQQTAI